ncbi:hydroxymethylglutaryl-mitochondrial-like [Stylonychia lemnae]|uniref:hydroxymethylglutaryl-CoA lyase n=1 Tax=Stylonychia lemnae TaxID=5949 RepID=A0A078AXC7_STYLE|nr:hydroxymethylglutaryl-mitochondrial-like [Stylonychia lemnae]|eukprot:CDW85877.1 hydroxymethylglutaryl-mitochondrial-like [Stylonychia lemnae]
MNIVNKINLVKSAYPHLFKNFPKTVKIVEVSPRDGLQNEKQFVPTETKINLINKLSESGLKVVESTSFVSPKAIPQMADAVEVLKGINRIEGVSYPVLVPNVKGMETALKCNVEEIAVFGAASEAFTQKNIKCSIEESLKRFSDVIQMAKENQIRVRGYVSCVMGCPYEGEIDPQNVQLVAQIMKDMGCYEISLGDTIGIGTPGIKFFQIILLAEKTEILFNTVKLERGMLAAHFHNTYDRAIQNLVVALGVNIIVQISIQNGISVIDSSVAGIGGCPYAKGASGNVATEDVLFLLDLLGIEHGVDVHKLCQVGDYISKELNRDNLAGVSSKDFEKII